MIYRKYIIKRSKSPRENMKWGKISVITENWDPTRGLVGTHGEGMEPCVAAGRKFNPCSPPPSTCPCPPPRPGEAQRGLKSQHAMDGQTPGADPAHARPASEAAGLAFPHVRRPTAPHIHTRHLLMSPVRNTDQASATLGGADSSPCQQMRQGVG